MKNSAFKLPTLLGLLFLSLPAFAMEPKESSFEVYEQRNLHKVLVVGCGHGGQYGHAHNNAWCVNLPTNPTFQNFSEYEPAKFKASVNYDEVLDITSLHIPAREQGKKEFLPVRTIRLGDRRQDLVKNILNYKNKFDCVVLEQPNPTTLNKHWTLFNAAHMLKVGGHLTIVTCDGYRSELYEKPSFKSFAPLLSTNEKDDQLFIAERSNAQNISEALLKKFGIEQKGYQWNHDMAPLACFLNHWCFTDIFNATDAHEPFTINPGENINTARKNRILCATKTQATEDKMEEWAALLQSKGVFTMSK